MTASSPFANRTAEPISAFSVRVLDGTSDPFFTKVRNPYPNIFQSHGFLAQIEKYMVTGPSRLAIVGVTDRLDNPVAAFAFVRRRKFGIWILEALDFGIVDYFAPAYFRETALSAAETKALWDAVSKIVPNVHAISFKKLPRLLHRRPHALSEAGFLKPMGACATTLHLDAGFRPEKMSLAREVRRKSKKLEKHGALTFSQAETNDEVDASMATLVAFRAARFSELSRHDALLDPKVVAFYRALADRGANMPIGRLFSLRTGERVVAVVYGFSFSGVFTLIAPAITTCKETQAGSPGLVIMFKIVEWCREQGFEVFDLSVGSLSYKSRFEAETVELFEHHQARTPLGLIIVAEASLRRWIRHRSLKQPGLRAALEKLRNLRLRSSSERDAHA